MTMRFLLTGLIVLPMLVSCVKQGDIDSLNARMSRNEQQMQNLSSQVGNVEQVLPGQAEMWAQMQAMRQELNMVRGQLDEMNAGGASGPQSAHLGARVARLEAAVRQIAAELGLKVEALDAPLDVADPALSAAGGTPGTTGTEGGTGGAPITTSAGGAVAGGTAATGSTAPTPGTEQKDTATRLYDSGMQAFSASNYREAVKIFTDFTKSFPKHNLTSNAHFWRGESYYQLKDYAGAALAYQDVIEKFPGSGKLQSSMLKQGMSFYYAGKKDAAKLRLNELVKKYPKSPEASRATKFMQQNK